ncbi:hypothetical protein HDU86_002924 [Geranomyces michiganensis]|nr:hypothetical protein HDU86_002924 [Geranomyces michiganensis]
MTMPDELPAPFPMSPSALPADACDSLLNDSEQKYFSEFLDTFWGPEDTLSTPLPTATLSQTHPHDVAYESVHGPGPESAGLYSDDRAVSHQGHDHYGQVSGTGPSHSNQYGTSSSNGWNQPRGADGSYEPPLQHQQQHRPGFEHERTFHVAEQHSENALPSWHDSSGGGAQRMLSHQQHAAAASGSHHAPPQLYIQTSRPLRNAAHHQQDSSHTSSQPSPNHHGQPTPQTALSSRNQLTGDTPASDEQDDSRSVSPTETPIDESPSAGSSARRGSASGKGAGAKPRAKNMKRRNGRELLTEQEKRTNHIVSEQKRRTLIRSGFKALAELVPGANASGNLGSSKSVILHNAVGFIRHLEYGNRALAEQLERLHKRYEMKMAAARSSGAPAPLQQPPPPPQPSAIPSPHQPAHLAATAHYSHHTLPPQQPQQHQSHLPNHTSTPAHTRPRSLSASTGGNEFSPYADSDARGAPHGTQDHPHYYHHQQQHALVHDQQPPSPRLPTHQAVLHDSAPSALSPPRQAPRRPASPSRA